jgi:VWFA-related protein
VTSTLRWLLPLLCAASVGGALRAQETETPSFAAEVELVTVDVVATDKDGNPAAGLTAADFTIREDGVPQQIVSFEAVQLPEESEQAPPPREPISTNLKEAIRPELERTFVIVVDDIHLTPFHAHRAKTAVAAFVNEGLRAGDYVTLVSTSGSAWWNVRMPEGRPELISMLKRLEGRMIPDFAPDRISDYEAMRIHVYNDPQVSARVSRRLEQYGQTARSQERDSSLGALYGNDDPYVRSRASEIYYAAATRNRLTLALINRLLEALGSAKGRKAMLLVSSGFIYDPNLSEFKDVVQSSRRSNVAIYFLDTRGLEMPSFMSAEFGPAIDAQDVGFAFLEQTEASQGSESLASDSGGFSVKNSNDLTRGIRRIAAESRVYYLLGYTPQNAARDGKFRKIQVDTSRKGIKLRARKGYFAPLPDGSLPDQEKDGTDPDIQRALDSPYHSVAVPIRMTAYVFDEALIGKAGVMIAADVDVRSFEFREEEGRFLDTLEFLLVVIHRETGEFHRYDQQINMKLRAETRSKVEERWFPILRNFELAAGGYQAKLVVRGKNSGAVGTLTHVFEVPKLDSFRLSTPLLSDALEPEHPGSDGRPRPAILARREFSTGSMLYCAFDVYGASRDPGTGMPKVSAGFEVRRLDDGSLRARVEPSEILPTSLGRVSRMIATSMSGASPGEYEIVLQVKDETDGRRLEAREPFTLVDPARTDGAGLPASSSPSR